MNKKTKLSAIDSLKEDLRVCRNHSNANYELFYADTEFISDMYRLFEKDTSKNVNKKTIENLIKKLNKKCDVIYKKYPLSL